MGGRTNRGPGYINSQNMQIVLSVYYQLQQD